MEEESYYDMVVRNYGSFQARMDAYGNEIDGSCERTVTTKNPWSLENGYFLTSSIGSLETNEDA
jgi:hypothetical protein